MRLTLCVLLLLAPLTAGATGLELASINPDEAIVVVNDVPIYQREVLAEEDRRINIYAAESLTKGLIYDEASRDQTRAFMRAESIQALVDRELTAEQLKADNLEVSNADVETAFLAKTRERGQTLAEATQEIVDQGKTLPQVKERIRWNNLAVERLYAVHGKNQSQLTDAEALRAYYGNLAAYRQEHERRVSRILINASPDQDEKFHADARRRAEALLQRIKAGEDFAEVAKNRSEDRLTAGRGGDRGWSPQGFVTAPGNDPFGDAAFALKNVGDVSDFVKTLDGYEIIKLTGTREARQKGFDEVKPKILADDRYRKIARFWDEFITDARQKAKVTLSPQEAERKAAWERKLAAANGAGATEALSKGPSANGKSPATRNEI